MRCAMETLREKLLEMQDLSYREFLSKLMPTVDKEKIIGILYKAKK